MTMLVAWSLPGEEFADQLAAGEKGGQLTAPEEDQKEKNKVDKVCHAQRQTRTQREEADNGQSDIDPDELQQAVEDPQRALADVEKFAAGDEQEAPERFFVFEDLTALGTAIGLWRESGETFRTERDHAAGRGECSGAVLEQSRKDRLQLLAVPPLQAPIEFLAGVAILQDKLRAEPAVFQLGFGNIAQGDALQALVPSPIVPTGFKSKADEFNSLVADAEAQEPEIGCLLYTSPSPRDLSTSRMPSSA